MQPIEPDVLKAIAAEAHEHGLPVFAHWGTLEDLRDVVAADVDGLEHTGRPLVDGWPNEVLATLVERDVSMTPTLAVAAMRLPPEATEAMKRQVREFSAAGGRVLAGSDVGMPGIRIGGGLHRELELLVDSGLTPREALVAATSAAAGALGTRQIGVLEEGRAADLLVVDRDPLANIRDIHRVAMVFREGRLVVDRRGELPELVRSDEGR